MTWVLGWKKTGKQQTMLEPSPKSNIGQNALARVVTLGANGTNPG